MGEPSISGDAANVRYAPNSFFVYNSDSSHFARSGFKVEVAHRIDQKIDDGLPYTGNIGCTDIAYRPTSLVSQSRSCGYAVSLKTCNSGNSYNIDSGGDCSTAFVKRF